MSLSGKRSSRGFTLVELLGVLSVLFIAASAGTQLDLVDLADTQDYLAVENVDTDSESLIRLIADVKTDSDAQPLAMGPVERKHFFLLQVACRELGYRQTKDAVPAIRRLAEHPDYFVAKHAKEALAAIESAGANDTEAVLPGELKELLPEGAKVAVAFPGGLRENTQRVASTLPARLGLTTAVSAIGNVEVGRVAVLYDTDRTLSGTFVLILVDGHFYQNAVVELLGPIGVEPQISEGDEWVGTLQIRGSQEQMPGPGIPVRVALVEGRRAAISLLADSIDEATLLKIAKAFVPPAA
jgi:HEAT repeat protein/pilin/secretion family protein with methylation motif